MLDFYGPDKKVYITNGDDYTHIIILNTAMPNIPQHISKENVIGLSFEPNVYLGLNDRFINYVQKMLVNILLEMLLIYQNHFMNIMLI